MSDSLQRRAYVQAVLVAYLELPETPSRPRPPDRHLAGQLHQHQVPLSTVRDALLLATARRLLRPEQAPRLSPIRSLYYFAPVIEEIQQRPLPAGYSDYLKRKIALHLTRPRQSPSPEPGSPSA
ncbi:MAG: hypothetical protein ACE5HB_03200 [Terriglobia bacterium]